MFSMSFVFILSTPQLQLQVFKYLINWLTFFSVWRLDISRLSKNEITKCNLSTQLYYLVIDMYILHQLLLIFANCNCP